MSEEFGPVTGDHIHALPQSGILTLCEEIRPEDSAPWLQVVDIPQFEDLHDNLSVAQSLHDLVFEFEDANTSNDPLLEEIFREISDLGKRTTRPMQTPKPGDAAVGRHSG